MDRQDNGQNCVNAYMKSIKGNDRITVEEEIELYNQMHSGSAEERRAARDRLICTNLRLVVKISHDFKNKGVALDDLIAEGNLGLMVAADKFEPGHGAKFSCYAAWWIKQAMHKALAWQAGLIRVPGLSAQKMNALDKAAAKYMLEHDREPTVEELSEMTGMSVKVVQGLLASTIDVYSMDEHISEESEDTFDEVLSETGVDDREQRAEMRGMLAAALDRLTPLERLLVTATYGIECAPVSCGLLAQEVGLSLTAMHERMEAALAKMRSLISADMSYAM